MNAKSIAVRIAAAAVAVGLAAACTPRDGSAPAAKGRLFGVSYQTLDNPFFVELDKGLKAVVEAHGDRLLSCSAQFDPAKQLHDVSDLVLKDVACIFINPVDWEGIRGSLLKAKERKIPCVIVDAPVRDADLPLCTVASDNVEAGRLAARALAGLKRPARIVVLHHAINKACLDRVTGFQEEVAKHPDMKVLGIQEGGGTTEAARPVMQDLLGRYPDLNAVFPINDPSALGAISAIESAGKLADIAVVTVDGSPQGIAAIKAGKLLSTSAQFPREIGRIAAEKAYDGLAGKPVEKDVTVKVELIDRENADGFLKKG